MGEQRLGHVLTAAPAFVRAGCELVAETDLAIGKLRLFGGDFEALFGFAPPAPRTQTDRGGATYAWMAPGEWLVTGTKDAVDTALAVACGQDLALALDITHGRAAFLLSGAEARTAIAGVSALDTRDRSFAVGSVARTKLGETGMFIARLPDRDGNPRFRIIVDQTMTAYAVRVLGEPASRSFAQ